MSHEAKQVFEMMNHLKTKVEKAAEASSLGFMTLESLVEITNEVLILFGVCFVITAFVLVFLSRASSQKRLSKVRKTIFIPHQWYGIASGVCAWQSLHTMTAVVIFWKAASAAGEDAAALSNDLYTWAAFGANSLFIIGFVLSLGLQVDLGYAVLCCMSSIFASFAQAASISSNLSIAGYLGLVNVLFATYWGVGIGKGWFKAEMSQALKEIEGWGVSKDLTTALGNAAGKGSSRKPGPRKPSTK